MKHRRPSRDNRGGAACILATYAVAAGALAVVYAAVNPLPATQVRDLVSPPAASASVPTRPLSVLPGMGAGLELVRIPRGLDVHTVPWSANSKHRPVHLNLEGGSSSERRSGGHEHAESQPRVHRSHHESDPGTVHRGRHEDAGCSQRLHRPERTSGRHHRSDDAGRHHVAGRHHLDAHHPHSDGDSGRHHKDSGPGKHAEHGGGAHRRG